MAYVIITGASRGVGYELAQLMADDGHKVLALSRNATPTRALNHTNITAFPFDITSSEDLKKLVAFLDDNQITVDILVNNAGLLLNKPFMATSAEEFKTVYEVNVFGVANITQIVLPKMPKNGHVLP